MRLRILPPALATILVLLCGCAPKPSASQPDEVADYNERHDPLEPTNRVFYQVNSALDRNVLHPVASGYLNVVPGAVRTHLHNTLSNLGNPVQFANDVLQGHPRKAGNTFMRLLINTTAGAAGVFDVATGWGFPDHDTDAGLTLAVWGIPEGPFLFLPVLGPSNPRDGIGYGANTVLDPLTWVSFGGSSAFGWTRYGVSAVDTRARVLPETDAIEKTALDPYATYRTLSQQHRRGEVEQARSDLPATVPAWYETQPNPAPASPLRPTATFSVAPASKASP